MSKTLSTVFCCFLLLLANPTCANEPAVLTACGHHNYPPWNWQFEDSIIGACSDITKRLLTELGVELDLSYQAPWKRCQNMLKQGKVDINLCSFMNPERQAYSDFITTPMGINEHAVFVRKDAAFQFTNWQDLSEKHVGMVLGVSIGKAFDDFLATEQNITRLRNYESAFQMLAKGRVDYVPFGKQSGLTLLHTLGLEDQIIALPRPLLSGNLYISMSKHSKYLHLLPEIEKRLQQPNYSNQLEQVLQRNRLLFSAQKAKQK